MATKEALETSKETSKEIDATSKEMRERIATVLIAEPASTAVSVTKQVGLTPKVLDITWICSRKLATFTVRIRRRVESGLFMNEVNSG